MGLCWLVLMGSRGGTEKWDSSVWCLTGRNGSQQTEPDWAGPGAESAAIQGRKLSFKPDLQD